MASHMDFQVASHVDSQVASHLDSQVVSHVDSQVASHLDLQVASHMASRVDLLMDSHRDTGTHQWTRSNKFLAPTLTLEILVSSGVHDHESRQLLFTVE